MCHYRRALTLIRPLRIYLLVSLLAGFLSPLTLANSQDKSGVMHLADNVLQASGKAHYKIHSNGTLNVEGSAKSFFLGSYDFKETYQAKPEDLRSERYQKVGAKISFDSLILTVVQVDQELQRSVAQGESKNGAVTFVFDISDTTVDLYQLEFKSRWLPVSLQLIRHS